MLRPFSLLALVVLLAVTASAQSDTLRRVVLTDGTVLVGTVDDERADPVVVRTRDGIEQRVPQSRIAEITGLIGGRFFRIDPTRTRLVITPTGRTIGKGKTRIGTLLYIVPQATVGLSDRVDLSGTLGFTFGTDIFSLTPVVGGKVGLVDTESFAFAVGANVGTNIGENSSGAFVATPFAAATFGSEVRSVSASVTGLIGGSFEAGEVDAADGVLLGFGGELQLNNGVKLLLDSLVPIAEGTNGEFIAAPGVRFFGDKFSVDVFGGIAVGDGVAGFAPIANFTYIF